MKVLTLLLVCCALAACSGSSTDPDQVSGITPPVTVDPPPTDDPNDPPDGGDPGGGGQDPVDPLPSAQLSVLSNRPDLVSAGDVLVAVQLGAAGDDATMKLLRNDDDVTSVLQPSADDPLRLMGVVDGLVLGDNTLQIDLPGPDGTNLGNSIVVTNHPVGGPVFSGPQIEPWFCQDSTVDAQCNQPVEIAYEYRSTDPDQPGLQPYDRDNPPDDVAMTTTDTGETVPFIVQREIGYMLRDRYEIKTLHNLDEPWTAAAPQSQWNGRLLVTHGGNCRGNHNTSSPRFDDYAGTIPTNPAIDTSYVTALGRGWSVLSTAQLNLGHNCNVVNQAESLMMVKERFVEQYGELRYTVGTGCSGGAITQNMIANAYPGLYQGLLTTCTYPDVMSTATQFADYHILLRYFQTRVGLPEEPSTPQEFFDQIPDPQNSVARDGTFFTVAQQNAVYGHENGIINATLADDELFSEAVDPQSNCRVPAEQRYHPEDNPEGARCDVLTFMKTLVGARQPERFSEVEQALGFGFAGFPLGNEGVQYGLTALQSGEITPEQFVALNVNVGAVDTDLNLTAERLRPDSPALPNAYRTGILNTGVNMDTAAIINMTGPDPGIAHDSVHGYWLRERFLREFGDRDHFVMWGGPAPLIGDPNYMNQSLLAMAEWLDAVEADESNAPLADKLVTNKPASLTDQCSNGSGQTVRNEMCTDAEMMVYGTPRTVAGNPTMLGDMVQCQLRPFSRDDNYGAGNTLFSEEDWLALEATFATGVCDYSQRPVGWTPTVTWLDYGDEVGDAIVGGQQMDEAPFPIGWASPAFSGAWEPGFAAQ